MKTQPTISENKQNFIMAFPTQGQSMFPLIKARCRLEIEVRSPARYRLGEIVVAFTDTRDLVAHRIIRRKKIGRQTAYLLKGDFNPQPDQNWLSGKRIVGRVVKIYYPLYTIDLLQWKHRLLGWVLLVSSLVGISAWRGWPRWKPRQGSWLQRWYRWLMG